MFKSISLSTKKTKNILCKMSSKLGSSFKLPFSSKLNNDSFASGTSASYLEQMYHAWLQNPDSVHLSWNSYFTNLQNGSDPSLAYQTPPTIDKSFLAQHLTNNGGLDIQPKKGSSNIEESLQVVLMIRSYQTYGFLDAKIDPLEIYKQYEREKFQKYSQKKHLDYKHYGFHEKDLEKEFIVKTEGVSGILSEDESIKLKDIVARLQKAYCSTIGVEFMYNSSREICNFIREKFENEWINYCPSKDDKMQVHDRLAWGVMFEEFLKSKFNTHKRFGLEGCETLISGFKKFVDSAVELGLKDITLGMPHRGRLNVLANVFRKPMQKIFAEFHGKHETYDDSGYQSYSGDVKYHLGTYYERSYPSGKTISMDLLPNPSHLEAVNPVAMGKTRAKQHFQHDESREDHMNILIHGDAAFAGQGVVFESMQMSNLDNFTCGGVLHVICNNQIGFTTTPMDGRSTPFCTDIGKNVEAPIIHVNAEDPIAVDFVFKTAAEFCRKFDKDIIIDVIGYRKHGHNELDQPMFTQPIMYKKINQRENVLTIFEKTLVEEGTATKDELKQYKDKIKKLLEQYYEEAMHKTVEKNEWIPKKWENLNVTKYSAPQKTGVPMENLKAINETINVIPEEFNAHNQIRKVYNTRHTSIQEGKGIDWATAEALAWGHLLNEGYTVRLTGQDVERGTFSHRHAVIHDQNSGDKYVPLQNLCKSNPTNFQIHNSHLSEFAVLGYELGFSYYSPDALVMWEAQFGDFANGAQVIIDQFVCSGEAKWNVPSGLTMLLPHGLDGQGPEHSSSRMERFLELMDDDPRVIPDLTTSKTTQIQQCNMQVCNPTFSANYFHVLIRQLKRQFRKPLIIPSPKKLLRLKQANSLIEDFREGRIFTKIRPEYNQVIAKNAKKVRKILVCSGQVYYDLINRREKLQDKEVAIIAVEQIAPFPYYDFVDAIKPFENAKLLWVQEEHMNQGAWNYVHPRIQSVMKYVGQEKRGYIDYVGRAPSSAPATGIHSVHERELEAFLTKAFE